MIQNYRAFALRIFRIRTIIKIACVVLLLFVVRMSYISCAPDTSAADQQLFNVTFDINALRGLLNTGVAVDARRSDDDLTPLMVAARSGDALKTRLFMEYGADINAIAKKLDGTSVLQMAVSNYDNAPNIGIVGLLLSNGANVGITDSLGNTLLHSVLRVTNNEDRMALFALLVKHGANINARNKNGDTMLHSAIENNHLNNNLPLINLIRTQFGALVDLGLRNNRGLTPIEYAQYLNATDIVYELQRPFPVLGLSGDVNAYDSNGLTPVMLAVIDNNKALVQTLIRDYLARIDASTNDSFHYSVLHLALFQQNLDMLSFLLSLGANPEQRDEAGRTAILGIPWMQTLQKRKQALDILVKVGGNINARDNDGNGLLYYLILHNDLPLFKYVLQAYGKIIQLDLKNNNADAPIDIARRLRRSEFVKILSNI